jgi:hypothetical protein
MDPSHRHIVDNQQLAREQPVTCDGSDPAQTRRLTRILEVLLTGKKMVA